MKIKDITPKKMQCCVGACPAILETDRGSYIVIGRRLKPEEITILMPGKVAPHEEAIEIPFELFNDIKR